MSERATDAQVWTVPGDSWPTLGEDDVHVWRAFIPLFSSSESSLERILTVEERTRARQFYFAADQLRFTVARALLRTLLGRYLDLSPAALSFVANTHGKPALAAGQAGPDLLFNLSHSGDWVVYAAALARPVGIDVEQAKPRESLESIARRFFCSREVDVLLKLPPSAQQAAFFRCWSRKEAYIKAVGKGLAIPLDQFEVSLAPDEPARLAGAWGEAAAPGPWRMRELAVAPDYAAAVVAHGEDWRLSCWEFAATDVLK